MKYKILAVIVIVVYFLQTFFVSFGGIGADSLSYFGIAADLPDLKTNLFPLGYPILLKTMFYFTQDYFWASKILNTIFGILILAFSYSKKFYFRETVLLLAAKTFYFAFFGAMSEGPFIFFMYFLLYFLHQLMHNKSGYSNALLASFMLFFMFTCRYSAIYVYLGITLFFVLTISKMRSKGYFLPFLLFLCVSGVAIGSYLIFNYMYFGSFTGEVIRGSENDLSMTQTFRNVVGMFNAIDPYIGLKPKSDSFGSLAFQLILFLIDIAILRFIIIYFRKAKNTENYYFHLLLWVVSLFYAVAIFFSFRFQQIEELGIRLMLVSNICLFFSFLILYFKNTTSDIIVWNTSCLFFIFLVLYGLKDPGNYLKNKREIEPQMAQFANKEYLFNNETHIIQVTNYQLPFSNKSFQYTHTNNQIGKLKESYAGTINPKIKWLKQDTVQDKSKVLYTSQLRLK